MVRAYDQGSLVAFSASRWLEVALCVPGTRLQVDHHIFSTWERNTRSIRARFAPLWWTALIVSGIVSLVPGRVAAIDTTMAVGKFVFE
jgi:hypothetical protein